MEMDDELENFIMERKARVAEDKACLEQDPPYMEMKAKPYRGYGSTAKENIPPKSKAQGRGIDPGHNLSQESCSVGLPLGVEYERKKQRLQHELRMDYRRYMTRKNQFERVETAGPLLQFNNRRPVKKDVATLTEESRTLHRPLCLAEDEERQSPALFRHRDRLGRPTDQESEGEECKDEVELIEGTRRMAVNGNYEKRRPTKTDGREDSASVTRDGQTSRVRNKSADAEFATGLLIGTVDTHEALQRRKERYRQELQEQIAEQHRNKKREKYFELKVAATGINDPEKQPDRIRQFGLSRRKGAQVSDPVTTGDRSSSSALPDIEKIGAREREMPPLGQAHVAFPSPLLEYSSALGLGGSGLPLNSKPANPVTSMDIPRHPLFHPRPPPSVSDAYRSPYVEPHHYANRSMLDPNMAYYGHMPAPGAGFPTPYWNVPPGEAVPSQLGNHSPQSQHSGSSFPEPPMQPSNETATEPSHAYMFPSERSRSARERILSYRDALKQQEASRSGNGELYSKVKWIRFPIQEQQERRRQEREDRERYEAQLEADMKNHQPWGRGGGGAPLRDSTGNLIADLSQMHKLNKEAYSNPEQRQRRATAAAAASRTEHLDPNERVSGFTHVQTPQFARGKVFASQPTEQQLQEQDKYKAYLKQQIEEKMHKRAEERERIRLEEEKEEKRLAEQRARIQREYEEEQERKKRKEMEQKAKNEELIQLAEQRKKEAERIKKEAEEKESAILRRQYEIERQARVEEVYREPSPPIPTLQKKRGLHQYTPRPPTADSQHSTVPSSERSLSGLQSPPVPACRNQLRAAGDRCDLFSELSALRRQLRNEQKRLEGDLQQADWEDLDSPLNNRYRERAVVDVFDMARLRLQAPVRRPNSRYTEPRNLLRIHDSLQLKYRDEESKLGSSEVPKLEEVGGTSRRRRDYRDSYHQLSSQRSTVQDDYFDLSPPQQNDLLRSETRGSARGSLLESESAFIDPLGDGSSVLQTPEPEKTRQLSARERRRLSRQSQRPQERAASGHPVGHHDDYSGHAVTRQRQNEDGEWGNRNRTGHQALSRRGNTAAPLDLSNDDDSPPRFSLHNRQGSIETDRWIRPETSDTLKCLDRAIRRERLAT
ncbi:centrosome and spindle pole associated protein 1-like isoform X3 [Astatotilapia calliptera]|uniref:centrosome and spindle pole associated protein 1-like isoform X3 n=1 Tax=Astatotilapia calliptera TaxID=8154 RepID=UPI000E42007F|nr:centrosome and spindle pole associated protein 1-like isoform X3 [Astatotilapia calliptera]